MCLIHTTTDYQLPDEDVSVLSGSTAEHNLLLRRTVRRPPEKRRPTLGGIMWRLA